MQYICSIHATSQLTEHVRSPEVSILIDVGKIRTTYMEIQIIMMWNSLDKYVIWLSTFKQSSLTNSYAFTKIQFTIKFQSQKSCHRDSRHWAMGSVIIVCFWKGREKFTLFSEGIPCGSIEYCLNSYQMALMPARASLAIADVKSNTEYTDH